MILDISTILAVLGASKSFDGEVNSPDICFMGETYSFKEPLLVHAAVINNGKSFALTANAKCSVHASCSRCLKDIVIPVDTSFDSVFAKYDEIIPDDDDIILFEGSSMDIDSLAVDAVITAVPINHLCSDECKGLCPICGIDKNIESCTCKTDGIDPRLSALADLLKDDN